MDLIASSQNLYIEDLAPNVTVSGGRAFKEIIKVK